MFVTITHDGPPEVAELNATAQVTPALPNLWFSTINYFALCVVNSIGTSCWVARYCRIGEGSPRQAHQAAIIALVIGGDATALPERD